MAGKPIQIEKVYEILVYCDNCGSNKVQSLPKGVRVKDAKCNYCGCQNLFRPRDKDKMDYFEQELIDYNTISTSTSPLLEAVKIMKRRGDNRE